METTGMVRRVDSLGRIVIPKEIRKVLKIKENEQVEIKVLEDKIVLNRYTDLRLSDIALKNLIYTIKSVYDKDILITSLNNIILTTNKYKNYLNLEISDYLNNILNKRKEITESNKTLLNLTNDQEETKSFIIKTVIKNGDIVGLIILLSENKIDENDKKLVSLIELFLDKYLE